MRPERKRFHTTSKPTPKRAAVLGSGTTPGANSSPRYTWFAPAVLKVLKIEPAPVSVMVINRFADVSVVVAYRIGFTPLKSTAKPRPPVPVPVERV